MQPTPRIGSPEAVVAGHICLDIFPDLSGRSGELSELLKPGSLHRIGPAGLSTGGAVANTGIALHRLGVATRLSGKVGDDPFGLIVRRILADVHPALVEGMVIAAGDHTSYSIVISPPGVDRIFLHHSGANDTFDANDVSSESFAGARVFHFGYPPLMRRLYLDGGVGLAEIFKRAKAGGLTTSLDMTFVDRKSEAAHVDWPALLRRVLPHVDVFLPSLDEIGFMLRDVCPSSCDDPDGPMLDTVAGNLLRMGCAVVALKLGDKGLYLRTTHDRKRLVALGGCAPQDVASWTSRQLLSPCFTVNVAGTTGSGDCTIAGFLAGLLRGLSPDQVLTAATGVGAFCVERPDATSGVPTWEALTSRIDSGWKRLGVKLTLPGWRQDPTSGVFAGPLDRTGE